MVGQSRRTLSSSYKLSHLHRPVHSRDVAHQYRLDDCIQCVLICVRGRTHGDIYSLCGLLIRQATTWRTSTSGTVEAVEEERRSERCNRWLGEVWPTDQCNCIGLQRLGFLLGFLAAVQSSKRCLCKYKPTFILYRSNLGQMNWAVVIFAGVMVIASVAFVVHARKVYDGPVARVRKLEHESVS